MSKKKTLALAGMLVALAAIFVGIGFVNNCTSQETKFSDPIYEESTVVPANGYGHLYVDINASGTIYRAINLNGTLRIEYLRQSIYQGWVNGSYKPTFSNEKQPTTPDKFDLYAISDVNVYSEPVYYIFRNTNTSDSVEVTLKFCQQTTQQVYSAFNFDVGVFLVATGTSVVFVAAFLVSKRLFLVVAALALAVGGAVLFVGYSNIAHHEEGYCLNPLTVPAGGYANESLRYNETGAYSLGLKSDNGTIDMAIISSKDFDAFSQGTYTPNWQNLNDFTVIKGLPSSGNSAVEYLVLHNPDGYDKRVEMAIEHVWDSYNLAAIIGGPALIAVGIALLWFANRRQIRAFNWALENQE
ncbi:MAG: hypothetical protein ACQCN4_12755 [Candidatus Bathyarchaeia archaeon]|jgi:hypothetical protein